MAVRVCRLPTLSSLQIRNQPQTLYDFTIIYSNAHVGATKQQQVGRLHRYSIYLPTVTATSIRVLFLSCLFDSFVPTRQCSCSMRFNVQRKWNMNEFYQFLITRTVQVTPVAVWTANEMHIAQSFGSWLPLPALTAVICVSFAQFFIYSWRCEREPRKWNGNNCVRVGKGTNRPRNVWAQNDGVKHF